MKQFLKAGEPPMRTTVELIIPAIAALIFSYIIIPLLKKIAARTGWLDKPNARKIHHTPIPLIGGIAIGIATTLACISSYRFMSDNQLKLPLLTGALIMLFVGAIDDRFNIKPVYRLFIQATCAYNVAASGIRIDSLYGILGINEIPLLSQYVLTIILITGVVNAFNLMDGIDGLFGILAIIGFSILSYISFKVNYREQVILFMAIVGSLVAFLRFNFSNKQKIFMGDAGSLFLGFVLITSAINLLNTAETSTSIDKTKVLLLVASIFLVPVLDSLRVYLGRIKKGISPFQADKTHLHHLLLFLGVTHKQAALIIALFVISITLILATLIEFLPLTITILVAVMIFAIITGALILNKKAYDLQESTKPA
ncbi:glycosyltransferase family 4 protein [Chryseosolibacter indicus]|uniref:Undecaprenyl/decaprenyl-phosphate alpha-N-acetylglucosaminyl 1-phosphate transferase n=1 Tax=Chryseosolibacter indicus TaxID=2782351 RepID=A0ABS5VMG0_9BACT|nr:MraY family glycosyltransferase [Chryseosolibacter indicus]MBT1701914.1 undecaprenyl/decaprenyl-phosphate alpha-N-acetylglucosaminyl 1-phosphate transferase [Chryseosolibacter indicus]